eukprot:TRINITY_DN2493_c0_g1_i5.p1 TRINITY_DN2493_c0_g1~~TRINITY_DN2493_c0_g1_i5.p1  ORF type:complete len:449 (+),score=66.50 TRINITY_DN2493_c0_g1_i5:38-1384(+)
MSEQISTPVGGKNRALATVQEVRTIETAWMKERKEYIREHNLHKVLGEAMDACIEKPIDNLPEDPLVFISEYLLRRYLQDKELRPKPKSLKNLKGLQKTLTTFLDTFEEKPVSPLPVTSSLQQRTPLAPLGSASVPDVGGAGKKDEKKQPSQKPAPQQVDVDRKEAPSIPQLAKNSFSFVENTNEKKRRHSLAQDWEEVMTSPNGQPLWYNKKLHQRTSIKPDEVEEIERDSSPVDWLEVKGNNGQQWYFNTKTGMKQWHKPAGVKKESCYPVSATGDQSQGTITSSDIGHGWTQHTPEWGLSYYTSDRFGDKKIWAKPQEIAEPHLKGTGWQEYDYQGVSYFVNEQLNERTWDKARVLEMVSQAEAKNSSARVAATAAAAESPQRTIYAAAAVAAADATKAKPKKPKTDPLSRKDIGGNWTQYKTEDDSVFYVNTVTKEKTWLRPQI